MAQTMVRILSIDGGGIRGIIPARWLAELERRSGKPTCELFDLIAGTSTGGIIALGLTRPGVEGKPFHTAANIVKLYEDRGGQIFSRSIWKALLSLDSLLEEKYAAGELEKVLSDYLGETMLEESLKPVLIPSYDIERRSAMFFKSWRSKSEPDHNFKMREVARATAAAPTYFEPAKLETKDLQKYFALIDGGVFANNPAMCAYAEARKVFPEATQFMVISLGTGHIMEPINYEAAKSWGVASWARPTLSVVFDGIQDTVDYQLRMLLPQIEGKKSYYRLQVKLHPRQSALDNATEDNIRALSLLGEELVTNTEEELETLVRALSV